ncbi:MAG: hypothetical protein ACR2NP_17300 [Pirellulaceae bacterium]
MFQKTLLSALLFSFFSPAIADAQREQRRRFVEDLLQGLIESQLDQLNNSGQPQPGQVQPGQIRPGQVRPGQAPPPSQVPPEWSAVREELGHISGSMGQLVNALRHASLTSHSYRQPLATAVGIKASCDAMYQSAGQFRTLAQVASAWSEVDQQWRSLAHTLTQSRGVSRDIRRLVEEVNIHETELCNMLGLQPQLDRTKLVSLTSRLSAEFRHLLQDIRWDMQGHPEQEHLLLEGRELMNQIRQSTSLIDTEDYDSIVSAYQQCQQGWRPYAAELREYGNDRIRRDVLRIEDTGRKIYASLWLPVQMDKAYLANMVGTLQQDVDHILHAVTLKDAMACSDPDGLMSSAREIQGACASFSQTINEADSVDDLVWDFRIFNVAWQDMTSHYRPIQNPEVQRHLNSGNETMALLEQSLGGGPQFSQEEMLAMCSQLEELCRQNSLMLNELVLANRRYPTALRRDIQREAQGLQDSIHRLHTHLDSRASNQIIAQHLNSAITNWNQLQPLIDSCEPGVQQRFRQYRGQLEPLFVKLQLVYSQ